MSKRTLVGVLGAVTVGAALLPGAIASGSTGSSTAIEGPGVVQLHLSNDEEYVKLVPSIGSPTQQAITSKKCVATMPPLLKITPQPTPPTGAVGIFDHGIGVSTAGEGS